MCDQCSWMRDGEGGQSIMKLWCTEAPLWFLCLLTGFNKLTLVWSSETCPCYPSHYDISSAGFTEIDMTYQSFIKSYVCDYKRIPLHSAVDDTSVLAQENHCFSLWRISLKLTLAACLFISSVFSYKNRLCWRTLTKTKWPWPSTIAHRPWCQQP